MPLMGGTARRLQQTASATAPVARGKHTAKRQCHFDLLGMAYARLNEPCCTTVAPVHQWQETMASR